MQIKLTQTCSACPQQYDATDETGQQVGYLRLRYGNFTVECPDIGGILVYSASPEGEGSFHKHEQEKYLALATKAIKSFYNVNQKYIVAYANYFDNILKQVMVEATSEVDAAYKYLAQQEDIVIDQEDRCDSMQEVIEQVFNMDSNISVYKLS